MSQEEYGPSLNDVNCILKALKDTRKLLSDESKWCKGALALDSNGEECSYYACDAVKWCLPSALYYIKDENAYHVTLGTLYNVVLFAIEDHYHFHRVVEFNDHADTTHEDILNVLDLAIMSTGKEKKINHREINHV